jgi:hypothetical protein
LSIIPSFGRLLFLLLLLLLFKFGAFGFGAFGFGGAVYEGFWALKVGLGGGKRKLLVFVKVVIGNGRDV